MNRRTEIDGLRAVALLPAILFHAEFPGFAGGYAGADVFFVISGYLITGIILGDLDAGRFSLAGFYERRVRRLVPALVLVVACCYPLAWHLLMPGPFRDFSVSMAAITVFASNILFWRQDGYFTPESIDKPLLQTWSLAVEEQYYVLFPLLVLLVLRLRPRWLPWTVAVLALASLGLSEVTARVSPNAAYFLAPSRAWEILAGALCAFHGRHRPLPANGWLAGLGLGLIALAFALFDDRTRYPGLHALVPVSGTMLVIVFGSGDCRVARLLSLRPLVLVGLISYSAYLWHQPVLVFARLAAPYHLQRWELLALVALTLVLGYLTWHLVEEPFRRRPHVILARRRQLFAAAGLAGLAIGATGLAGHVLDGMPGRFAFARDVLVHFGTPPGAQHFVVRSGLHRDYRVECGFAVPEGTFFRYVDTVDPACITRDPALPHAVLLWGDSFAQMLAPGLVTHLPADWQLLQVTAFACPPRLDPDGPPGPGPDCNRANRLALDTIARTRPDVVVISQAGRASDADILAQVARLVDLGVGRVIFAGPPPGWGTPLPDLLVRHWKRLPPGAPPPRRISAGLKPESAARDREMRALIARRGGPHAGFASILDALCDTDGCLTWIGDDVQAGITSFDTGHLMPVASRLYAGGVLVPAITGGLPR